MLEILNSRLTISIVSFIFGFFITFLAIYTWKKHWIDRQLQAAKSVTVLMLCASLWLYGLIVQLNLPGEESKKYLEYFLYIGPVIMGPTWFVFALQWVGKEKWLKKRMFIAILYGLSFIFYVLVLTNDFHGLIFKSITYVRQNSIFIVKPEFSYLWWIFTTYIYSLILLGVGVLIRAFLTSKYIYRRQAAVLITGTVTPFLVNILYNIYFINFIYFDFTPISFAITGVVYYWGFSRFKLIEIVPIARDAVFENMKDLVLVLDSENRIVDANPSFLKTFNLDYSNLIGKKVDDAFSDKIDIVEGIKKGEDLKTEIVIRSGGNKTIYDMQINSLRNANGNLTGRLVSLRDITLRKKMEEELVELNIDLELKVKERTAQIEKLLREKEEFIWQLSHDLKSPLTPIIGLLPTIIEEEKDPKLKELLRILERNANYMKDLVVKTLELERIGSTSLNVEKVDVSNIINEILENKKGFFLEKEIDVENNLVGNLLINGDKIQLQELFDNLLTNAIKYTPNKGKVRIDSKEDDDSIVISFTDTGIGLEKDQIERIFDEFYKVDQSRHDLDSSGLGLAICKRIVEKHGGKIWAESPGKGKGSTFYVKLNKA